MKVANLKEIFNKFWKNDDRAILIDGAWGVGKTHYILEFLKELKNRKEYDETLENQNIAYISLFGKSSINEIHTDIYTKFHPVKARVKSVVNIVPKVAALISDVGGIVGGASNVIGNLEYSLRISEKDKICKNCKDDTKRYFVFLDDFERLDFEQISFNEILGYVNSLIMQGLKVVVICNAEEINRQNDEIKRNFIAFKEKVFDREYKITATNEEVIKAYFKNIDLLDENIIKEFNNNLRLASRASNFYSEVSDLIPKCNNLEDFNFSEKTILKCCVYVIVAANTERYHNEFEKKEKKEELYDLFITHKIEDENILQLIEEVGYHVSIVNGVDSSYYEHDLLNALFNLYFYGESKYLVSLFIPQPEKNDLFLVELLFLSDDEKRERLRNQYEYILSGNTLENVRLHEFIDNMYAYPEFSFIDEKEEEFLNYLVSNRKVYEQELYHLIHFLPIHSGKGQDGRKRFSLKLSKRLEDANLNDLITDLKEYWEKKRYNKLVDRLEDIRGKQFYLKDKNFNNLKDEILKSFKDNDYFITRLLGNIHPSLWYIAHIITDYAIQYSFKEDVIEKIKSVDTKDDLSAKQRYSILLEKLSK